MPKISDKLKAIPITQPKAKKPVWDGPESNTPNGGITYSLLSRFLTCRERFRVMVIDGLRGADAFNQPIEFGNMWHACEEAHAENLPRVNHEGQWMDRWECELRKYAKGAIKHFPMNQEQIQHCHDLVKTLFPYYVRHWAEHPDV